MTELSKAGFSVEETMRALPNTLNLAQAAGIGLGESSGIVANTLRAFEIQAERTSHAVDVLGLASISANTTVPGIAEALKYVGSTAHGLGIPLEEIVATISAMAQKGIDASSAGTALNAILKNLAKPTKEFKAQMEAAGISTEDLSVAQRGFANVLETVVSSGISVEEALGQMDARAARAFGTLRTSIPFVRELTKSLYNSDGTIKQMAETMDDNLNGALLATKSAIEAVVIAFGELGAESSLTAGLRGVAGSLRVLAKHLGELISLATTGAAAWAAYFVAIKASIFTKAAASAVKYAVAVGSGNAVALGSAVAEAQKAAAVTLAKQAEIDATRAALARIETETAKAVVLKGSQTAEFARLATLKQVAALEAQLATQTAGLAAAQAAEIAATKKSTGVLSKLGTILPGVTAGVKALTAAIAANPLGAIAVGITVVIGLLITFRNKLKLSAESAATLGDLLAVLWDRQVEGMRIVLVGLKKFADYLPAFKDIFGDLEFSLSGVLRGIARFVDYNIAFWTGLYHAVVDTFIVLPLVVKRATLTAMNALVHVVENKIHDLITRSNELLSSIGAKVQIKDIGFTILDPGEDATKAKKLGETVMDGFAKGLDNMFLENWVVDSIDEAEKRAQARIREGFDINLAAYTPPPMSIGAAPGPTAPGPTTLTAEQTAALEAQKKLFEQIKAPIEEYKTTLAAANALLEQGKISLNEYNAALQQTQLSGEFQQLQLDLMPEGDAQLAVLEQSLQQRLDLLKQFQDAKLISEQEASAMSLELHRQHNAEIQNMELARYQMQLSAGSQAFGAMAKAAKGYAGEQSKTYRALFALSKGFAIAETTVAIAQGIANAAKLGWPANIAAIAGTIAQTAGLIGQIQSAQFSGSYQTGGSFRVGGSGGADSQLVALRASPNETVSVRTPSQQKSAESAPAVAPQEGGGVRIVNVTDPGLMEDFLTSPAGERTLVNAIQRNGSELKQVLR